MIDEEFANLVEQKSIGKKLNINNKEAIEEFFVDEDISTLDRRKAFNQKFLMCHMIPYSLKRTEINYFN